MFTTIIITQPFFVEDEAERITEFLRNGSCDYIHIRKPWAECVDVERLLRAIPAELHCRLTLHDHFELAGKYLLHGLHTNSRNPSVPSGFKGCVSRSLHSIDEVEKLKSGYSFVSLSPIFDSISKRGYLSAFTPEQLAVARTKGIIDEKVFALGGVTFALLPTVREMGFGGAMILGAAWR
ncbi:MAG: thiamine phosphate synthase [Prevotella sp.]|nr:thiamine phosphate synthase [Prevotella sp.]